MRNGLANERDFSPRVASHGGPARGDFQVVQKFGGHLCGGGPTTTARSTSSPGTATTRRTSDDLDRFMTIGTISYDHPDLSIFTVLDLTDRHPGLANIDFVIFPPRWLVGEDTFRPPWFHRNIMSEFMGLIHGVYDAKAKASCPGVPACNNTFTSHGPDAETYLRASTAELAPHKVDDTLAFMLETRWAVSPTAQALAAGNLQSDYDAVWGGIERNFSAPATWSPAR
ncbi:homogentisate 1,2-dioxygenase domain-containing protein [Streptomyces sp. L7]